MTMTTERKPSLPYAIRLLRDAVDRLTKPHTAYINNHYIEAPSLYRQLQTAVEGQQSQTGTGSGAKSKLPFWVDAVDQLHNIDLMVNIWPTGIPGPTERQLRALAAKTWTVDDSRRVRRLASIVDAWCDDIERLLSDEHGKHLSTPCPACGAESVLHRDSAGDMVRTPALTFDPGYSGCTCRNCDTYWAPDRFLLLAEVLGLEPPEGVVR